MYTIAGLSKYIKGILLLFFLVSLSGISFASEARVKQFIFDAVAQFNVVDDYTCHLDKRVRKNGNLYEDLEISVKYKKPNHYYFRWNKGISKGREVIFVEGKYNDKLVAHPGGLFNIFTFKLDPEGALAMQKNRHSLRNSGMEQIITLIKSNYAMANKKDLDVIRLMGEGNIDGKKVWIVEGHFPENQGFYAHKISIFFCQTAKLPLKISIYNGSDQLVEEYVFRNLKINVGLTENDFNPSNPKYSYLGD